MTTSNASLAFEHYLETQPPAAQTGCLLWLWASQGPEGLTHFKSQSLQQVLSSLEGLSSEEGVTILSRQSLSEVVGWTMIHEFGASFKTKSVYPQLVQSVCQRLQDTNETQALTA